jgi:uncharacterized membrane protein YeiH
MPTSVRRVSWLAAAIGVTVGATKHLIADHGVLSALFDGVLVAVAGGIAAELIIELRRRHRRPRRAIERRA